MLYNAIYHFVHILWFIWCYASFLLSTGPRPAKTGLEKIQSRPTILVEIYRISLQKSYICDYEASWFNHSWSFFPLFLVFWFRHAIWTYWLHDHAKDNTFSGQPVIIATTPIKATNMTKQRLLLQNAFFAKNNIGLRKIKRTLLFKAYIARDFLWCSAEYKKTTPAVILRCTSAHVRLK